MFNWFAKILLTCTSMAPVGFVYAWVAWWQGQRDSAILIAVACACLVPLSLGLVRYARTTIEIVDLTVDTIEPADRENTAFLLLYLLPLFTDKFTEMNWSVWIPLLAIFAFMTATGYNYHFNPLLNFFGWHFYRIQSNGVAYVLVTRRHLRSVVGAIKVCQLTEYIMLDTRD